MKLICKGCGNEITQDSKFCTSCGTKVEGNTAEETIKTGSVCSCGKELTPGVKFCTGCGAKVEGTVETSTNVNSTNTINSEAINNAAKNAEEVVGKVAKNAEVAVNKAVNTTKEFVANNKGNVKPFLMKNKLILIIAAIVIAVGCLGVGVVKLQASPKKTVEGFAKSFSKLDIEKALKYTNAESSFNAMFGEYGGSMSSFILEMQKELVYDYGKFKMEIIDMDEIFKTSTTANYLVTFKITSDIDSGSPYVEIESEELSFVKEKGKWLINFMTLADMWY